MGSECVGEFGPGSSFVGLFFLFSFRAGTRAAFAFLFFFFFAKQ